MGGMSVVSKKKPVLKGKLSVVHAKCPQCGFERIVYFTSDSTYGERVVSTKSGKHCAYVNLFEESIGKELEAYCEEYFSEKRVSLSGSRLSRIASSIYGITCDNIFGEKVDTTPNTKCPGCNNGTMVEDKDYGEQLAEVEVSEVTHDFWNGLDKDAKRNEVKKELARQGYSGN